MYGTIGLSNRFKSEQSQTCVCNSWRLAVLSSGFCSWSDGTAILFYPLEFNHSIIIRLMSDETLSPVFVASDFSFSKCSFDKKVETLFSFCLGFAICFISFTLTIIAHNTYTSSTFYVFFKIIFPKQKGLENQSFLLL